MKDKYNDIGDDEIRVLGDKGENQYSKKIVHHSMICHSSGVKIGVLVAISLVLLFLVGLQHYSSQKQARQRAELDLREKELMEAISTDIGALCPSDEFILAETGHGFIVIADTVINDIPMRLYFPHRVSMSLHLGAIDRTDSSILFAAQAADVRADNGGIVGAFVLKGEPKAWGQSKKGFCAIINDTVTIGVADNSPLFEEATEKGGYFFRQFPLVDNRQLVENEQRGKSIRRALCGYRGVIFTVETLTAESFHDFAQALADLGVDQAISLVGSNAYGWATDAEGQRHEFGNPDPPKKKWENINYLVMRAKN